MKTALSRRRFLAQTASAGAIVGALPVSLNVFGANNRLRLAVMGVNSRGTALTQGFSSLPDVEVAYVCDPDPRTLARAASMAKGQDPAPRGIEDFRHALDDPSVDALVVAAPNHWHAPATILGCAAGKHVYVEKPACHDPAEGEWMVAAARKHNRVVQVGTQRRSMPRLIEAMAKVQAGELGDVRYARCWYNATRGTIGRGRQVPVPAWLNWELWQGPAPVRPFRDNLVHYNWHWFWHWGNGELGNNGIHALDLCRWGLGVDFPRQVTSGGGRYMFDDDQETPDTQVVTFDFGDRFIAFESQSCRRHGYEGSGFGAAFYGDKATMIIDGGGYKLYDAADKPAGEVSGSSSDQTHLRNFVDCVRDGGRPNADVEEGYRSTLLCLLGNIAWRLGRTLHCDSRDGHILNDPEAAARWTREYRPGWEPVV